MTVDETLVGERLDSALAGVTIESSRSGLKRLIEAGQVLVNNRQQRASYRLRLGDQVVVSESTVPIKKLKLPIIYQDHNLVVINKPAGVLSHSKGVFNAEPSVASWLKDSYGIQGLLEKSGFAGYSAVDPEITFWQSNRAGIVHRLDRGTSGLMICAKNAETQTYLQKQFAKRNVKKTYQAIVDGQLKDDHAIIDMPIERNPKQPATFRVGASGKVAQTEFWVEQRLQTTSLVRLMPRTGRTHQLRVHLKQLGHPIKGDIFYGGSAAPRLCLHASRLEITIPTGNRQIFNTPPPDDFLGYLK